MTTLVPHRTHITKQSEHNILQSWNQHVSALWTKLWSFKMVLLVLLYIRTLWNWEINACKQINKCLAVRLVYLSPHTHTHHTYWIVTGAVQLHNVGVTDPGELAELCTKQRYRLLSAYSSVCLSVFGLALT